MQPRASRTRLEERTLRVPDPAEPPQPRGASALPRQGQEVQRGSHTGEGDPAEHRQPRAVRAHAAGSRAAPRAGQQAQQALHWGLHDDVPDQAGGQRAGAHDRLGQENSWWGVQAWFFYLFQSVVLPSMCPPLL